MKEITLILKDSQRVDHNKWMVTISGEERMVTTKTVMFSVIGKDWNETLDEVNKDQIESVTIKDAKPTI